MMNKKVGGFFAFLGSWVAMCSIGELVLGLTTFAWVMVFGVITCHVSTAAQKWIEA